MVLKICITVLMILSTTAIHASAMTAALRLMYAQDDTRGKNWYRSHVFQVSWVVCVMFCASLIEAALWAAPYVVFGPITTFEEALYFSMVTFTTLGYGDVLLPPGWRLLAAFEAANGIIIFGWTTAIVMAAIRHVYLGEGKLPFASEVGNGKH